MIISPIFLYHNVMSVCFFGSSVTYGFASNGISFVEILAKKYSFNYIKEAICGTTLVDSDNQSYFSRLKRIEEKDIGLFVVQLSTNDAIKKYDLNDIKVSIERIIDFIEEFYNSKIVFFSNPYYLNEHYEKMVSIMKGISCKKNVYFIDMFSNKEFNNIGDIDRILYMQDNIHPTLLGYEKWIVPFMEKYLSVFFKERNK